MTAVRESSVAPAAVAGAAGAAPGPWERFFDSDLWYSFRTSPVAISASIVALVCLFCAVFANLVAPHNPFDLATLELTDARLAKRNTCSAPTARAATSCPR